MFQEFRKEIEWGGRTLVLESGKIARQADGAVMATYGDTRVLCTVVGEHKPRVGLDFFPLAVHYQEKTFAAGKIPGGFFKREGRPSEKETLTSRLIDRPIRPLFVKGFRNETQVICTVLSHDMENDPDIVALIGTSAALTLSGLPFMGPIAGCRVGYIDGEYVLNPPIDDLSGSALDLVVAGTRDGVLMVDDQFAPLAKKIRAALNELGAGKLKFVLNTHWHGDHTGGNPEFGPEAAKIIDPIMGWTGSADTREQVHMTFDSRDEAVAFARKNGFTFRVEEPKTRRIRPKNYADNFRYSGG